MTRAELLAYLGRDWSRAREVKDRDTLLLNQRRGWEFSLGVAEDLVHEAVRHGYRETEEERATDWAAHVACKARLDVLAARLAEAAARGALEETSSLGRAVVRVRRPGLDLAGPPAR